MLVLGIESASDQCGCALAAENGVIAEARLAIPRRHAEALAPQMRFVCEQAGVALGDVDVVAVDNGPGLFTGLRAGLATAKATAAALGIGVAPVGSLEALAFDAGACQGDIVVSALDARRGEIFWAVYLSSADGSEGAGDTFARPAGEQAVPPRAPDGSPHWGGRLVQMHAPRVGAPESLAAELAVLRAGSLAAAAEPATRPVGSAPSPARAPAAPPRAPAAPPSSPASSPTPGDIILVGDGALRYADLLATGAAVIAGPELRFPSPAAVALLGRERALAGGTVPPEQVDALYLRSPDARPPPPSSE